MGLLWALRGQTVIDLGAKTAKLSGTLGLIKRLATRAAFMLDGKIVMDGTPKDVVNRYVGYVLDWERKTHAIESAGADDVARNSTFRHGDGSSRVTDVQLTGWQRRTLPGISSR